MIIIFENFKAWRGRKKPDINSVSTEFWKMVQIANWKSMIRTYQKGLSNIPYMLLLEQPKKRLYLRYDFNEIVRFLPQYDTIYFQLYDYFENILNDKKYEDFRPGDDGYTDLISSVVGKGKTFVKKCIDNPELFIDMARDDDYVENFRYLLQIDEKEYGEIKSKYDPLYRDTRKYNL